MKHFVKAVKVNIEHPVPLLLDNHYSHLTIDVLGYCKDNGVVLLSFPPHCSHKLQPLNRTVFGPLKKIWGPEQQTWMRNNPGKTMTIFDLPGILIKTWPQPRGCIHQDYIRGSPSENMEKNPKVSNYFAYYPKVSSSLMERTQKYHRIVKRQKWFTEIPICITIYNFASHQSNAKLRLNIHQLSSDNDVSKYLLIPHNWKSQCIKEILRKNSI